MLMSAQDVMSEWFEANGDEPSLHRSLVSSKVACPRLGQQHHRARCFQVVAHRIQERLANASASISRFHHQTSQFGYMIVVIWTTDADCCAQGSDQFLAEFSGKPAEFAIG